MTRPLLLPVSFLPLLLVACASPHSASSPLSTADRLAADLQALSPSVVPAEARALAQAALAAAAHSAKHYRPIGPAWANNALVNTGLRPGGLCYHWRNDLVHALAPLRPRTLQLHLAESRRGTLLEHHALVLTAQGQPFEQGILLDAWRHSGRLWWGPVAQDRAHRWQPVAPDWFPDHLRPLLTRANP